MALSEDDEVAASDPDRRVPVDDEVARRLTGLVATLRNRYGDSVVTKDSIDSLGLETTRLVPPVVGSCHASWIEIDSSQLILVVGVVGRWEMSRDQIAVKRIEDIIDAVIRGRVVRLFGFGRTTVIASLDDGRTEASTKYDWLPIPLPGWQRIARRLNYTPYDLPGNP